MLALVAALTRAAVPAGFMPTTQGGMLDMTICGGGSAMQMTLDLGQPADDRGDAAPQAGDHCLFAAASAAGVAPAITAFLPAPYAPLVSRVDTLIADLAPGRGLAAPPPPSHAPPILI